MDIDEIRIRRYREAETTHVMKRFSFRPLRENPWLQEQAADWFSAKWGIPLEEYRESIHQCIMAGAGVPQWYVILEAEGRIAAGYGVIENDFHERKDLKPNLCALYVEKDWRGQGMARYLLNRVREDMAAMGVERLYLVTDHREFYEKCGWSFLAMVRGDDGAMERMYEAQTAGTEK